MSVPPIVARAGATSRRILAAPGVFPLLIAAYVGVLLVILAPVIATSIGADDSYWILQVAPESHGSFWAAAWEPLKHAFDFDGQPRTTALGTAERRVIALAAIQLGVLYSIPPAVVWAFIKIALLVLAVVATGVFLRVFRFRGRDGVMGGFPPRTRAAILLILPLVLVIGVKAETVGTINGWLFYPSFTYGPFVVCLLIASLAIALTRFLDRRFSVSAVPVILLMALLGFALNLSYETHAISVPVTVLAVLLQPLPDGGSRWARWRGRLVVLGSFAGVFTIVFLWIRWRISQMACYLDDTCYAGSVVHFDPRTLVLNVIGALPGRNGELVAANADAAGRDLDGPTTLSIVLAVAILAIAGLLWASRSARKTAEVVESPSGQRKGLLLVAVVVLVLGVGGAMITGLSQRAVDALALSSVVAYRTGVLTWTSFALVIACVGMVLLLTRWRLVRLVAVVAVVAAVLFSVSTYFPRNVVSAQINRAESGVAFVDTLHREVSLGDISKRGDARRCEAIEDFLEGRDQVSNRFVESLQGAYDTYEFYYGVEYCTTGAGLDRVE